MTHSPIWHPFTQHALLPDSVFIDRAEGAYLYAKDGRRIIDAISSWWVNIHGHNHPKIVAAVQEQAAKLDQIIFAGFTHEPAERLAEKLVRLTPPNLTRVFYSDSGSTAVEVALKMALGYWVHKDKPRGALWRLTMRITAILSVRCRWARAAFSAHPMKIFCSMYIDLPFPETGSRTFDCRGLREASQRASGRYRRINCRTTCSGGCRNADLQRCNVALAARFMPELRRDFHCR